MVCMLLNACSNTRYLQQDQSLLTKTDVKIEGELPSQEKTEVRNDLSSKSLMLQQPNSKLLGTRLKVWLYNQKSYEKKSNWFWSLALAERNLEAPAIYDSTRTKESVARMLAYLNNQGYFYATVNYKEETKRKKTSVTYEVATGKSFVIKKITYDIPDTALSKIVKDGEKFSLVKKGQPYKAENLNGERERLTRLIRDAGYFKFNRELVTFSVDTLNKAIFLDPLNPFSGMPSVLSADQRPTMDIEIVVKNPEDSATDLTKLFYLNHIFIYPDFPPNGNVNDTSFKTYEGRVMTMKYHEDIIRPRVLARAIQLRRNEKYSITNYNNTVNRLYDLNLWQFVTIQYREAKDTVQKLDAYIMLSPKRKQELSANIDLTTSTDYFIGSGLSLGYRHLNLNRSANELHIAVKGGLELARPDNRFELQAREYGVNGELVMPRFLLPFKLRQSNRANAKTRVSAGYNALTRIDKFDIRTLTASFGYEWNESQYKRWMVKPFQLNYVGVTLNKQFEDSVVAPNPYLRRSFEPAFIGGEGITFTYSNADLFHQRQNSYFRTNFEESGMWLKGVNGLTNWVTGGKESLETASKVNISQFLRLELDYRHYWNFPKSAVATRAYAGLGVPYGQSDVLPYIRQFTAGGPNSIRAWRLRTLGPGSYRDTSSVADIFPDQTGDMKLEGNVEYRFNLFRLFGGSMNLKGATFLDFGNIWMLKKDTLRAGADIQFKNLYKDLAIGTGLGLRVDFTYFVIRLDWGIPIKKPYPTKNSSGWYLSEWTLGDVRWRRENIIWNIAIGYPF